MNEERVVPIDIGCQPSSVSDEVVLQNGWSTYLVMEAVSNQDRRNLGNAIIKFKASSAKYGYPNDEGTPEHRLYNSGLRDSISAVNEVLNSRWVKELNSEIEKSSVRIWGGRGTQTPGSAETELKHLIISLKEGTFECVCSGYSVTYSEKSISDILVDLVSNELEL